MGVLSLPASKGGLTWSCSGSGRGQEGLQARGQAPSLAEVGLEWHPLLQAPLAISGLGLGALYTECCVSAASRLPSWLQTSWSAPLRPSSFKQLLRSLLQGSLPWLTGSRGGNCARPRCCRDVQVPKISRSRNSVWLSAESGIASLGCAWWPLSPWTGQCLSRPVGGPH